MDDEDPVVINVLLERAFRDIKTVAVELAHPAEFAIQIASILISPPDVLVLDLRLDEYPSPDGQRAGYRAAALAQELRTRVAETRGASFPIVLWSVNAKLDASFRSDVTGQDLFDAVCSKNGLGAPALTGTEIVGLAFGYKVIADSGGHFLRLLGLVEEDDEWFDGRVGGRLRSATDRPAHEYAQYVMRELIETPGLLIDGEVVAARLGVHVAESQDWVKCLLALREASYAGAFAGIRERWWAPKIETWWRGLDESPGPLRSLTAGERVGFLQKRFGWTLRAAEPILPGYSDRFWTVCAASRLPLDPRDGFMVDRPDPKPWQEPQYMSARAVVNREAAARGLLLHPLERPRFRALLARSNDVQSGE